MPNLAPSTGPARSGQRQLPPGRGSAGDLLDDLRLARMGEPSLPALTADVYARSHAAFETLSDQRELIGALLAARFAARGEGAVAVLSVGCGDGALDAPLAAALAAVRPVRDVRYVGVDPFAGSTAAFATALRDPDHAGLSVESHTVTFEDLPQVGTFDVVTFVHSMYYVRDVAEALRAAYSLLRPGGELLVLSAPRAELNALVEVLAPPLEGHVQWFSDDVARGLEQAGLVVESTSVLHAGFDAGSASDEVLDFAVQAQVPFDLRALVRAYLAAVAVPTSESGGQRVVPHPVDVYRVVRPV